MPRRTRLLLTSSLLVSSLLVVWLMLAVTSATAIESGRDAVVSADGDCLRLRATAGTSGQIITCLPEGTVVSVLPGTLNVDGSVWRLVSINGQNGWVVEQYLRQAAEGSPAAAPPGPMPETVTGLLPASGGGGLVVWSGGPLSSLLDETRRQGCEVTSLWVTDSAGAFVNHIVGAPDFVNSDWNTRFPAGQLPPRSPYILVCDAVAPSTDEAVAPPPPAASPTLTGDLPTSGGFGLVVWGGGPADTLVNSARGRGCDTSSVWTNNGVGEFISYIAGAPAIVNAAWAGRFPDEMPGDAAVVVVCRGKEAPPSSGSGLLGPSAIPPGIPASPPGPAGNQ